MAAKNSLAAFLQETDPQVIAFTVFLGLLLIGLLFLYVRSRGTKRRDFLLMGLPDAGKSTIFMQIVYKKLHDSFTSMTENLGEYKSGRMSGRIVDVPGHYRTRGKYFDQYKGSAKGVIFVLDAVTAQREIRDIADALYTVLADPATAACPFLILCNKQDLTPAKGAQLLKGSLEKEINILRDTRGRKLQAVGEDDGASKAVFLGKAGRDFEFAHLPQNVQFYECSAKENQLSNLTDWIDRML